MKALTIRRLRPSDAEALYRILSDRQVMRYLEPPYDRLQTEQFLREAGLAEPPLVYGTEEDGRLLGYVIYHAYDPDSMELGWVLSPDCWGKGYASRLTDRLVELAHRAGKTAVIECVPEQTATRHCLCGPQRRAGGIPSAAQRIKSQRGAIRLLFSAFPPASGGEFCGL